MRLLGLETEAGEGPQAEARQGRNAARIAAWYWVPGLAIWYGLRGIGFKLLAALCLLGALWMTAKAAYHFAVLLVMRLDGPRRAIAQVVIALVAALLPLAYFVSKADQPHLLADALASGWSAIFVVFVGYLAFHASKTLDPDPPIRAYLVAVAGIAMFSAFYGAAGRLSENDEYGATQPTAPSLPNADLGLLNYVRYGGAAYVGISIALLRRRERMRLRSS